MDKCIESLISGNMNARSGNIVVPQIVGMCEEDFINRNVLSLIEFAATVTYKWQTNFSERKKYDWSASK